MQFKIGDTVSVPRFNINKGTITAVYPDLNHYGVTGKTAGGFSEYRNMSFHADEVKPLPIIDADQDQRDQLTTRLSLRREK